MKSSEFYSHLKIDIKIVSDFVFWTHFLQEGLKRSGLIERGRDGD